MTEFSSIIQDEVEFNNIFPQFHFYEEPEKGVDVELEAKGEENDEKPLYGVSLTDVELNCLHLLCSLYRCRHCLPNAVDLIHDAFHAYPLNRPCCVHAAISESWPKVLPASLIPLTSGFLLNSVSESFLTSPIPQAYGPVKCKVIRVGTRYDLFLEIEDREAFILLKNQFNNNNKIFQQEDARRDVIRSIFQEKVDSTIIKEVSLDQRINEMNMREALFAAAESVLKQGKDVFLLSALRRGTNQYDISRGMQKELSAKTEDSYTLGKIKSNWGRTEFVIFDNGYKVKEFDSKLKGGGKSINACQKVKMPREAGVVQFASFFGRSGSPVRMKVLLPNRKFYGLNNEVPTSPSSSPQSLSSIASRFLHSLLKVLPFSFASPAAHFEGEILRRFREEEKHRELTSHEGFDDQVRANLKSIQKPSPPRNFWDPEKFYDYETPSTEVEVYENLRPVYHERLGAYVLYFDNQRVESKSFANFKLVRMNDNHKKTILQFGIRKDINSFCMDVQYPLSLFQAFSICVAAAERAKY